MAGAGRGRPPAQWFCRRLHWLRSVSKCSSFGCASTGRRLFGTCVCLPASPTALNTRRGRRAGRGRLIDGAGTTAEHESHLSVRQVIRVDQLVSFANKKCVWCFTWHYVQEIGLLCRQLCRSRGACQVAVGCCVFRAALLWEVCRLAFRPAWSIDAWALPPICPRQLLKDLVQWPAAATRSRTPPWQRDLRMALGARLAAAARPRRSAAVRLVHGL
mmetsp:Transcript_33082/g.95113  ORF Transcript_33082/g.95113 Transcript_33082/m.95113 type:complete len:216 (-) Transcript_33082:99-746(-)